MPRVTIQQFRAALAGRFDQGRLVRAYREITRRPEVATGLLHNDWGVWQQIASAPANA